MRHTPDCILLIFVKYPEPGKVKTRLAEDIGKEKAAEIYSWMAETVIRNASKSKDYKTTIFFDPPEREIDVENWLNGSVRLLPQEGKSLGERMSNAFREVFSHGAGKTIIIGTDCVEISDEIISQAFDVLDLVDVVLGPAEDGGYYLLGLKKPAPKIFDDIDWSTELVLNQTLRKIEEQGLRFVLLKKLRDIDTVNELSGEILLKIQRNDIETENTIFVKNEIRK
ncbi:MAG: TIGR04282 family arsenosugar biosynthesis glycosyltransferase [Thermodesulfobacteriota bacterium]